MASVVYKHCSYYAIFSVAGRNIWLKIGKVDRVNAKKILRKLQVEFAKYRLNLTEMKPISVFDFIDKYQGSCLANKAVSTCKREGDAVKAIKAYFRNIPVTRLDNQAIEGYKARRVGDERKPATINKELAILRFICLRRQWNGNI
jgi:hypothetical protein